MDKALLVMRDIDAGGRVLEALSRTKIPITLFDWHYVPELGEWQLVIATPWYQTRGPLRANESILNALQKAGVYENAPLLRLYVCGADDRLVREMEGDVKAESQGSLHVIQPNRSGDRYRLVFVPFQSAGAPVPSVQCDDEVALRDYLDGRLRLRPSQIEDALADLRHMHSATVFPVQLTRRQAKRAGLG